MNPGAPSRKGEVAGIKKILKEYYPTVFEVRDPCTAEAGDIMRVGSHFYIGLSSRRIYSPPLPYSLHPPKFEQSILILDFHIASLEYILPQANFCYRFAGGLR